MNWRAALFLFCLVTGVETSAAQVWSFRDCIDCPEVAVLPPGDFIMGTNGERDSYGPARESSIQSPFAISRTEITFREYEMCVEDLGCPGDVSDHGWGRGERPVINVSWDDAVAYTDWLSRKTRHRYRLPTETEWEYAARAGSTTKFPWGDAAGVGQANCRSCGTPWSGRQSAPVGQFAPNAFGLFDMHGNVSEWVANCWTERLEHSEGVRDALKGCTARVTRGGDWYYVAALSTSAARKPNAPNLNSYTIGFRVVREIED